MDISKTYRILRFEVETHIKSKLNKCNAESVITSFHHRDKPSFIQHNTIEKKYDLMIVLPVYNVEKYLEQCLDSLFAQKTKYSYIIVAVNDGSTDSSGKILESYQNNDNLTIIHQENRGFSGARNRALERITASYVMFVDSDDYISNDAVESFMNVALEKNADLIAGGFSRFSEEGIIETVKYGTSVEAVSVDNIPGYTCMKVIKSDHLKDFCFPSGFRFEDTVLSKLVFPLCKKTYTIPNVIYFYRSHSNSISSSHHNRKESLDTYWITRYCLEEAVERGIPLDEDLCCNYLRQCWVNYIRTRTFSEEIQESIFVLTRELFMKYFPRISVTASPNLKMLYKAFRCNSYKAYKYVMTRWDVL